MMTFLDKLNLRPQERRLVVGIFVVVFIVLNVAFVWPHFSDWTKVSADLQKAKNNLAMAQAGVGNLSTLQKKSDELKGAGLFVLPEEQALNLRRTVENQAMQSSVMQNGITQVKSSGPSTNQFFEEQSISMAFVNTAEKDLVDFLYNLGANSSMIRVRALVVKPDPSQQRLQGTVTLTASYQKKAPAKVSAKPVAAAVPATNKPAALPVAKPATNTTTPPKATSTNSPKTLQSIPARTLKK